MPSPISTASFATQLAALLSLNPTDTTSLVDLVESWDPTTPADLATLVANFVASVSDRDTGINSWAVGTASGGPNGDGMYPISLLGGGTVSFPSIPKLLSQVTHGADAQTGLAFDCLGPWNPNEMLQMIVAPGPLIINTALICGYALASPTGAVTLAIQKNGAAWGTVTFGAGSHNTVTSSFSSNTVARGDALTLFAPSGADATFANFAITLPGVSG